MVGHVVGGVCDKGISHGEMPEQVRILPAPANYQTKLVKARNNYICHRAYGGDTSVWDPEVVGSNPAPRIARVAQLAERRDAVLPTNYSLWHC